MEQPSVRVLMTADAIGGVWQYATELANALQPLGFETLIAVLGPAPSDEQRQEIDRAAGIRLIETGLPLDWLSDAEATRAAAAELAAIARREKVDVIHLNSPALAGGQSWPVPVVGVAHGCLATWWDTARARQPLDPAFAWHREMMAQGLRACDRTVAPSASFAQALQRVLALPSAPLVVHNGRTLPQEVQSAAFTQSALTAGRLWDEVKNVRTLDAAAALLSYPFEAAGEMAAPHGETATVNHLQPLGRLDSSALAKRLALRPVFVSAATFEPFGLSILEAAGAGCALILSDIPTFRELWDGVAIFVEAHDASGFAKAIEVSLGSPEQREAFGDAARMRALQYTSERMASGMAAQYRELLAARLAA
jgi:glycosyltransferase involved in cell wall biosynthesis